MFSWLADQLEGAVAASATLSEAHRAELNAHIAGCREVVAAGALDSTPEAQQDAFDRLNATAAAAGFEVNARLRAQLAAEAPADGRLTLSADGSNSASLGQAPASLLGKVQASGGREYVDAATRGTPLTGAAAELNAELGVPQRGTSGGVLIPLEASWAASMHGSRLNLAQISSSAGGIMGEDAIVMPLRNMPMLSAIGIRPTPVVDGRFRFVRVSKEPSPALPAEGAALTAGTFELSFSDLVPRRIQVASTNSLEAEAINSELSSVLISTMSSAMDEALQSSVMGSLFALGTAPDDASALLTYTSGRALLAGALDAKLASSRSQLRLVIGSATLKLADSLTPATGANDMSLYDLWMSKAGAVVLSNDVPAVASKNEQLLVIKGDPVLSGSYRFIQWRYQELITANSAQVGNLGANNTYLMGRPVRVLSVGGAEPHPRQGAGDLVTEAEGDYVRDILTGLGDEALDSLFRELSAGLLTDIPDFRIEDPLEFQSALATYAASAIATGGAELAGVTANLVMTAFGGELHAAQLGEAAFALARAACRFWIAANAVERLGQEGHEA